MAVFEKNGAWWIDYRYEGQRKRERIGSSKRLAEQVLAKRKVEIAEGKFLDKRKEHTTKLCDLIDRYLKHTKDKKRSHVRDKNAAVHVKDFFGQKTVGSVNAAAIENYRAQRKLSTTRFKKSPTPATINREVTFLKTVFSWAVRNREISDDPAKHVRLEKENNVRDRVLSDDEFKSLLDKSPAHLKPILIAAYHTAMRKAEILNLRWPQVDLKAGFISLAPEDTKTNEGRRVPLHPAVKEVLKGIVQRLDTPYVFLYEGKRIKDIKRSFGKACRDAGITNFRIHDFRHTAITNSRRAGHDFFTIMAASGHKSMATFKRYNTVSENDLQGLVRNAKDGHLGRHQEKTAG